MFQKLNNLQHIRENNTTYFSHMKRALYLSLQTGLASIALLIHSVFPNIFEKTGSTIIYNLHTQLNNKKDE